MGVSALDRRFATLCQQEAGTPPFQYVSVYPPYFEMHRFKGWEHEDSDIWEDHKDDKGALHEEYAHNLYTARR